MTTTRAKAMNEKELGKLLLDGGNPPDAAALTERVLRRDRRRIWLLSAACVVAWMAVVMLPWATIMPMVAKIVEHQLASAGRPTTAPAGIVPPDMNEVLQAVRFGTIAAFLFSLASMLVAAACTVSLIVVSRRATLRQVNARLTEISAHLRSLAQAAK